MKLFDVACIGVVLLDLPLGPLDEDLFRQETTMVGSMGLATGGDAFNEAVILARLGKKSALVGQVGADMLGDLIVKRCEEEGVDHSGLCRDPETDTRINVVIIGKDGQRHFIKSWNAGSDSFKADDIDCDYIRQARAVSLASIFCSKLRDTEAILKIVKTASEGGAVVFADMVPPTGGETIEDISEVLPYLDYFLPNKEEAIILTGFSDPDDMADSLLRSGVKNVIIKLGKDGCLIKNDRERYLLPACPVKAVDTTGAGDNFTAGFIAAVLDGMDLESCGTFANAAAAISTETVGATAGVKDRSQVERFLLGK